MQKQRLFSAIAGYIHHTVYILSALPSFLFFLLSQAWQGYVRFFISIPVIQKLVCPRYGTNFVSRMGRIIFTSRSFHSLFGGALAGIAGLVVYYNITIASFDGNYYITFGSEGSPAYAQESADVIVAIAEVPEGLSLSTQTSQELTPAGQSENRYVVEGVIRAGKIQAPPPQLPSNFIPSGNFLSPLRNPPRLLVTTRFRSGHPGIDMSTELGTPLYAISDGVVSSTGSSIWAYGKVVVIDHGNGMQSLYAHMSRIDVKVGDYVTQNSLIGAVGSTGNSTGPHVHLEVHNNGRAINPVGFVAGI